MVAQDFFGEDRVEGIAAAGSRRQQDAQQIHVDVAAHQQRTARHRHHHRTQPAQGQPFAQEYPPQEPADEGGAADGDHSAHRDAGQAYGEKEAELVGGDADGAADDVAPGPAHAGPKLAAGQRQQQQRRAAHHEAHGADRQRLYAGGCEGLGSAGGAPADGRQEDL